VNIYESRELEYIVSSYTNCIEKDGKFFLKLESGNLLHIPENEIKRITKENLTASQKNNPAFPWMNVFYGIRKAGNHNPHGFSKLNDGAEMRKRQALTNQIMREYPV
jgi:hypothetical protein